MKKSKTLALVTFILLFATVTISCSEIDLTRHKDIKLIGKESLEGTRWKLVGDVYVETGDTVRFEPKECEDCYTLTFETHNIANFRTINRVFGRDFRDLSFITWDVQCEVYPKDGKEYCDADGFRIGMLLATFYIKTPGRLEIYDETKSSYLLFKPID